MFSWLWLGGWMILPLLVCSIWSVAIFIEKIFFWLEWKKNKEQYRNFFLDQLSRLSLSKKQLFKKKYMDEKLQIFKKKLPILETMISLTPMLGIIGSTLGVMHSFQILQAQKIPTPAQALSGVSESLISTALGLLIAAICLIMSNLFWELGDTALEEIASWDLDS